MLKLEEMLIVLEERSNKVTQTYPDLDMDEFNLCIHKCAKEIVRNLNEGNSEFKVLLDKVNMGVRLKKAIDDCVTLDCFGLQIECKMRANIACIKINSGEGM